MRPLTLLLLASSVSAQPVVSGANATAWVSPVSGAIGAAGTDQIAGFGSVSLSNLSMPNTKGSLPFLSSPQLLAPLAAAVQAQGYTPETFQALGTTAKLDVLRAAAKTAEAQAETLAAAAVAAVEAPLKAATRPQADEAVKAAEAVALYLPAARAGQVEQARKAVKAFEKQRSAVIDAFMKELPGKISAGEFNAGNLIKKEEDGWRAADGQPTQHYASLVQLYEQRLARMAGSPIGPWTTTEASLLTGTLEQADVASALEKEKPGATEALRGRLKELAAAAAAWDKAHPGMSATLARFQAGKAKPKDVLAIEKFYENSMMGLHGDWTGHSRILGAIDAGQNGAPSWAAVQARRRELSASAGRSVWRALAAYVAAMIAMLASGVGDASTGVKFAVMGAVFLPMIWLFVNIWRRDSMGSLFSRSYLGEVLRKYFPSRG